MKKFYMKQWFCCLLGIHLLEQVWILPYSPCWVAVELLYGALMVNRMVLVSVYSRNGICLHAFILSKIDKLIRKVNIKG